MTKTIGLQEMGFFTDGTTAIGVAVCGANPNDAILVTLQVHNNPQIFCFLGML